jgi:hypothetical protein
VLVRKYVCQGSQQREKASTTIINILITYINIVSEPDQQK